jgi:long-chain acyl-CoA synthetase
MTARLFDIVSQRASEDPKGTMFAAKEGGQWQTYSAGDVWATAQQLAGGLQTLGISKELTDVEGQEKIAIISQNRPEWMMADVGVQLSGAVLTPIYPTIAPNELRFVLSEAGVRIVFVATEELYERFGEVLTNLPSVEHVFTFDTVAGQRNWKELLQEGRNADPAIVSAIKPETLATIIYTSGTTGDPKGVMLTHRNIGSNIDASMPCFTFANKGEKALSFLPLNHIFERMVTYIYLQAGLGVYYAESMETIGDNLREVHPIVFTTVPRLLEKVYERILGKGLELKGVKRGLFFWALGLAKQYDNAKSGGAWYDVQLKLANKIIFSKWREALGGQVRAIVSGSAALQERLNRIFSGAGIVIMEGYGLTESSPVITVNRYESEGRRIGSVGPLVEGVEVKLAEDGEILAKGPNIMLGYYKRPELTAEVMKDGWFHTGDIGTWTEGRFLKITDRKKEIFKTSGGKYVAPQVVENKLRESPYVEQMMVVGAGRKFVSALIVPAFMPVRKHFEDAGKKLPASNAELIRMPEVVDLIQKQIDKYNPGFSHVEQVKKFALLPQEWTVDTGELTPSLKIKRKAIDTKFANEIEGMY